MVEDECDNGAHMNNYYEKFISLFLLEKFDEACEEFKNGESKSMPSASLLVKKGMCILLSSEKSPYSLRDAEVAFKDAIKKDENCIEAYVELAYFYLNVNDQAETAIPYFEKAIEISRKSASEAIGGIGLCISEIKSPEIALDYLKTNCQLSLDDKVLDKIKAELAGRLDAL